MPAWKRFGALALGGAILLAIVPPGAGAPPTRPREEQQQATPEAKPSQETSLMDQGMDLVKAERYEEARKLFERLARDRDDDPDVLNMLAYTQRKTGKLDQALENYHRALELRPDFPQAREYLGEAYLQAALREIETLRGYGDDGREAMRQLVDAFHAASAQLEGGGSGSGGSKSSKW
jgi:tetratricopeptide (TPR) repeat protein